jgi:hypothetical protein
MNENARAIQEQILKGMPGRKIQYQRSDGLHKYRIEGNSPTHWLYVSEELVDDSEPVILINVVNVYKIVDTLNKAEKSRWLYLSRDGIREVDENFSK